MADRVVPRKYDAMYGRRKGSRKASIRYFCLECVGFSENEVKECTDKGCSLWRWRLKG
jgi:hypothetical protein